MPLEAGDGFISGLVATNPVNASDQVAQGDDHLRLIKTAVKGTFPNLNGAVTCSPAELNILDGATLSTAELNILDGATLSTAELNILDGVTLTAAQINDALQKSSASDHTVLARITTSHNSPYYQLHDANAGSNSKYTRLDGNSGFRVTFLDDSQANPVTPFDMARSGTTATTLTVAFQTLALTGSVSTPGSSASEVGYSGTPLNTQNGDYTLVLTDRGKTIYKASGGAGETITIPANASVAFPGGTQFDIVNNGGGDLTIAITTDTLSWAVGGATGSRTLADHGWAVIKKVASTEWLIAGTGLS